jgi:hypothetical protein
MCLSFSCLFSVLGLSDWLWWCRVHSVRTVPVNYPLVARESGVDESTSSTQLIRISEPGWCGRDAKRPGKGYRACSKTTMKKSTNNENDRHSIILAVSAGFWSILILSCIVRFTLVRCRLHIYLTTDGRRGWGMVCLLLRNQNKTPWQNQYIYFQFCHEQTGTPVLSRDKTETDRPTGTRATQIHSSLLFWQLTTQTIDWHQPTVAINRLLLPGINNYLMQTIDYFRQRLLLPAVNDGLEWL